MVIIGITGMIAAGKTTICSIIGKKYNAAVFDADLVAKMVIESLKIDNQGIINNPSKIYKVEQEMMPTFIKNLELFIKENQNKDYIILDIPLLYEFSLEKYCDKTVNVYCNFDTRVKRIQNRENMDIQKFMFLNNKQMGDDERNSKSDYTINTECDMDEMASRIDDVIKTIGK